MTYELTDLKPLTAAQYDQCKARSLQRIEKRAGDKPKRATFYRELGPLWTVLDLLALVIFLAALAISSVHILVYAGGAAMNAYTAGNDINLQAYVAIHKVGFIALAESAMLLFFVGFRMRRGLERWLSLALAVVATSFVVTANLASGLTLFLAALAPAFTVGIGFRLEALIAETLRRRADVDARYLVAMANYEAASKDAAEHPDYAPALAREIWDKLVLLKANQAYADAPPAFKRAAVLRELERDMWAADGFAVAGENLYLHTQNQAESAGENVPFGRSVLTPGGHEFTPTMQNGKKHLETENVTKKVE